MIDRMRRYGLKTMAPTFDPCIKCLVSVSCSKICSEKILFDDKNKKPSDTIRFTRPSKRKSKK